MKPITKCNHDANKELCNDCIAKNERVSGSSPVAGSASECCGSCRNFTSEDVAGRGFCEINQHPATCDDYCGAYEKPNA